MFRDLLAVFVGESTLGLAAQDFQRMLELARNMSLTASASYWQLDSGETGARRLALADERMNELQQAIRRRLIVHLSGPERVDAPYCLSLMSLVKDVERIGDYAKNLAALPSIVGQADAGLPVGDVLVEELQTFARDVEGLAKAAPEAYQAADAGLARELVKGARVRAGACDDLLRKVAGGDYDAATATRLTLTIRFYKRIQGHFANLLSSMLMPLDRLDHFDDEGVLPEVAGL